MKQINLMPWREQAREYRKKEFFNLLAAALIGSLLIVAFFHFMLSSAINNQEDVNSIYQQDINTLNQQLSIIEQLKKQQQAIVERIGIIDRLQTNRSQTVNIFTDLVKTLPQGVYLTAVKRTTNDLMVAGKAESNARISMFMRNLETVSWLDQASLTQIQANASVSAYDNDFVLDLKLKPLQGLDDLTKKADADKNKKPGDKTPATSTDKK